MAGVRQFGRERWLPRFLLPVLGAFGVAITMTPWSLAPPYLPALGILVVGGTAWLFVLSERMGRETLEPSGEGGLTIQCPALVRGRISLIS